MKRILLLCIGLLFWAPAAWAAYPQHAVDRTHIIDLLKADRFADLDALFSGLQDGYEQGRLDELTVFFAFRAFNDSDPALQAHLEHWEMKSPDSFAAHQALGDYHQRLGRAASGVEGNMALPQVSDQFGIAKREYVQALSLRPKLIPAYIGLIRLYDGLGRERSLKKTAAKGLRVDPASYLIHYQALSTMPPKWGAIFTILAAYLKQRLGPFASHSPMLRSVEAYLLSLLQKWGGSDAAMADYLKRKVRPYESRNPLLKSLEGFSHYQRASELEEAGSRTDLSDAQQEIDAALRAGMNPMYVWERADIYRDQGRFGEAVASYSKALEQRPQTPGILTDRGWCYYRLGDMAHALQDYDDAIGLDRLDHDALRDRGILHYSQKQLDQAKADLQASLVYGDGCRRAHRYLGYIAYARKEYQGAEQELGKAISLGDRYARDYFYLAVSQWAEHRCSFVKTAHAFLRMCRDNASACTADDMRWAKGDADYAVSRGICPG